MADGTEVVIAQQDEIVVEGGGTLCFRVGRIEKEYLLGERVLITPHEYGQIAQGCIAFCTDLGSKLPDRVLVLPTSRGSAQ